MLHELNTSHFVRTPQPQASLRLQPHSFIPVATHDTTITLSPPFTKTTLRQPLIPHLHNTRSKRREQILGPPVTSQQTPEPQTTCFKDLYITCFSPQLAQQPVRAAQGAQKSSHHRRISCSPPSPPAGLISTYSLSTVFSSISACIWRQRPRQGSSEATFRQQNTTTKTPPTHLAPCSAQHSSDYHIITPHPAAGGSSNLKGLTPQVCVGWGCRRFVCMLAH